MKYLRYSLIAFNSMLAGHNLVMFIAMQDARFLLLVGLNACAIIMLTADWE